MAAVSFDNPLYGQSEDNPIATIEPRVLASFTTQSTKKASMSDGARALLDADNGFEVRLQAGWAWLVSSIDQQVDVQSLVELAKSQSEIESVFSNQYESTAVDIPVENNEKVFYVCATVSERSHASATVILSVVMSADDEWSCELTALSLSSSKLGPIGKLFQAELSQEAMKIKSWLSPNGVPTHLGAVAERSTKAFSMVNQISLLYYVLEGINSDTFKQLDVAKIDMEMEMVYPDFKAVLEALRDLRASLAVDDASAKEETQACVKVIEDKVVALMACDPGVSRQRAAKAGHSIFQIAGALLANMLLTLTALPGLVLMMQLLADGATLATIASKENAIKMRESWTSMRQDDHEFHEEEVQELMQRMYDVICKCNTVFNLEMFKHWKVEAGELLLDQIFLCGSARNVHCVTKPTLAIKLDKMQLTWAEEAHESRKIATADTAPEELLYTAVDTMVQLRGKYKAAPADPSAGDEGQGKHFTRYNIKSAAGCCVRTFEPEPEHLDLQSFDIDHGQFTFASKGVYQLSTDSKSAVQFESSGVAAEILLIPKSEAGTLERVTLGSAGPSTQPATFNLAQSKHFQQGWGMFGGTFDSETAEDIVCDGVSKGKADGKALHRVVIDKLIGSVVALDQKQPDAVIQHQALYCPENVLPRMAFELARSFGLGLNNDDWLCSFLKLDASIIMMHRIGLHAAALGCEDGAELPKHVFAVLVAAALTLSSRIMVDYDTILARIEQYYPNEELELYNVAHAARRARELDVATLQHVELTATRTPTSRRCRRGPTPSGAASRSRLRDQAPLPFSLAAGSSEATAAAPADAMDEALDQESSRLPVADGFGSPPTGRPLPAQPQPQASTGQARKSAKPTHAPAKQAKRLQASVKEAEPLAKTAKRSDDGKTKKPKLRGDKVRQGCRRAWRETKSCIARLIKSAQATTTRPVKETGGLPA